MLGLEKVTFVRNREECLFEKVLVGVERDVLLAAGGFRDFSERGFCGPVCKVMYFLVSRDSNMGKAMGDLYAEVGTT